MKVYIKAKYELVESVQLIFSETPEIIVCFLSLLVLWHIRLPYKVQSKYKMWYNFWSTGLAKGNDWHAMSRLRDKRQKQSMSVNSAAARLCALCGSCRLPYLRAIAWIAPLKLTLPIVPEKTGISQLVQWDWQREVHRVR